MGSREDWKRRLQLGKVMGIKRISDEMCLQQKYQNKQVSEDTRVRQDIQAFIRKKVSEGRTREDILKRLRFVYHDQKYAQYRPYFEVWGDAWLKGKSVEDDGQR